MAQTALTVEYQAGVPICKDSGTNSRCPSFATRGTLACVHLGKGGRCLKAPKKEGAK